jgi:transposase-like protein
VSADELELKQLRKELQETKLERDILKKAESIPPQYRAHH